MSGNPKISVIVPCFNRAGFLDQALGSVKSQTFADWECIIVNGGTDDTASVAQKWVNEDTRFRYFEQKTSGPSQARNFGVHNSSGTYIFPLDDDDHIACDYFEKAVPILENDPGVKVVHSKVMQFGHVNGELFLPEYSFQTLLLRNCMICCALYRREEFDKVGGYDENLFILEDWDFWLSMLDTRDKVHKIEEFLYFYRKHASGSLVNTFAENRDNHRAHLDRIYKKHVNTYLAYHGNPMQLYRENLALKAFRDKTVSSWPYRIYKLFK